MMHTSHTVLMKKDFESEAHFIVGNPLIVRKTKNFVNPKFKFFPRGTYLIVTFRATSKRHLMRITAVEFPETASSFTEIDKIKFAKAHYFKNYLSLLKTQQEELDRKINLFSQEKVIGDAKLRREYNASIPLWKKELGTFSSEAEVETKTEAKVEIKVEAQEERQQADEQPLASQIVKVGNIYMNGLDKAVFEATIMMADQSAANVLMVGPSGCGKTSIPEAIAKEAGMDFFRINCAAVRDPEEWFGYREAVEGSTVFKETGFTKAIRQGNTVIVLDEFNRVEPWLHNTLYPLLDHAHRTTIHNEEIVCGPNTLFVATINSGSRFTGTFMLDSALTNRMDTVIHVGYLAPRVEARILVERIEISTKEAQQIVKVMEALREANESMDLGIDISTRSSLKIARMLKTKKLGLLEIIGYTILNIIEDEVALKNAVDAVNAAI